MLVNTITFEDYILHEEMFKFLVNLCSATALCYKVKTIDAEENYMVVVVCVRLKLCIGMCH